MTEVTQRPQGESYAEIFEGTDLPDIFECIAGWLRSNPHISVLHISTYCDNEGESVTVFYE